MNSPTYFLVMGNTRVGSTWLNSSFHRLPEVSCAREIRWWMPYQHEANRNHIYVDCSTRSMKERIGAGSAKGRSSDPRLIGAKFKLDPYGFVSPVAPRELARIIEDDIYLILLRRSYFEIFGTWKTFGIRHLANPAVKSRHQPNTKREDAGNEKVNRFYAMYSHPLERKKLILTSTSSQQRRETPESTIYYPVRDAIDDMLVLFFNDLVFLSLARNKDRMLVLDYSRINTTFYQIASSLGVNVTREDCEQVLRSAPTVKLEPDGDELVEPSDALRAISDYLDSVFHDVLNGRATFEDVVRHDPADDAIRFRLPKLAQLLAEHKETRELAPSFASRIARRLIAHEAQAGEWLASRPIYVPKTVAAPDEKGQDGG